MTAAFLALVAVAAAASARDIDPDVAVRPHQGGKHTTFVVSLTTERATGVLGQTRRSYRARARRLRPRAGCVMDREAGFPDAPAGVRVRGRLDPRAGKGGDLGWCRGRYRGTVTYEEGFACPAEGTCRPPAGFPHRREVVGRFSFRVR